MCSNVPTGELFTISIIVAVGSCVAVVVGAVVGAVVEAPLDMVVDAGIVVVAAPVVVCMLPCRFGSDG